ncbi:g10899 [Coccomyxa viridis]|uniref:G10899 protein n=1 Tax=Coccomyxa viridis TaxID=1274662 RepID=A0ABP1G6I3_9CHLO
MQTYDRNVWLAASLLVLGGILVILGVSLYVKGDPEDSGIILTTLGCVLFLPGFWASYHAYTAWKQLGYSDELMSIK